MPESIVKKYYEALEEGNLLALQCEKCRAYAFPPVPTCPSCGGTKLAEVNLSGRGTLMYVSHGVAPPPNPRFEELAPYAYGHVMLEEGIPVEAIIDNVSPEPEAIEVMYEKGPVPVTSYIKKVKGLPVLMFRV